MAIIRWDPFREMTQVQNQFGRLVDQVWGGRQESWLPAVDVFDRADAVVLKAELAGMDPDDIEIEDVQDNPLDKAMAALNSAVTPNATTTVPN